MTIGGPGYPRPVLPPGNGENQSNQIQWSRGVDLSALKHKKTHKHCWIVVANFMVTDEEMVATAEKWYIAKNANDGSFTAQILFRGETLFATDGPGCLKCGVHWQSDEGYGKLCPVGDDEYEQAKGQKLPSLGSAPVQAGVPDVEPEPDDDQLVVSDGLHARDDEDWIDSATATDEELAEVERLTEGMERG